MKLKIYGMVAHTKYKLGQWRYVAAFKNQREFADLIGCTISQMRDFACITGNLKEVQIATMHPHKLIAVSPSAKNMEVSDIIETE